VRWQHSERGDPAARRPAAPSLAAGQTGTATRHTQRCRTPYGNCGNGSIILGRRLGGRGNVAETRFTKRPSTPAVCEGTSFTACYSECMSVNVSVGLDDRLG
jgi:hypothetical protein